MSLDVCLFFDVDTGHDEPEKHIVYEANYTHNCGKLAAEAGCYGCVWRPDEHGITHAKQIIEPLRAGIAEMVRSPQKYRPIQPRNGWGDYDSFVKWLQEYLQACEKHPNARVEVSR